MAARVPAIAPIRVVRDRLGRDWYSVDVTDWLTSVDTTDVVPRSSELAAGRHHCRAAALTGAISSTEQVTRPIEGSNKASTLNLREQAIRTYRGRPDGHSAISSN